MSVLSILGIVFGSVTAWVFCMMICFVYANRCISNDDSSFMLKAVSVFLAPFVALGALFYTLIDKVPDWINDWSLNTKLKINKKAEKEKIELEIKKARLELLRSVPVERLGELVEKGVL